MRKPRLVKVELAAPLLNLPFVAIFLYLLYSNRLYWDLFNDTLSRVFGVSTDWVSTILVLLFIIAAINLTMMLVGALRIELLHRVPAILASPAITMGTMMTMLAILMNVVDRVNLDYIFFLLGNAAFPVYAGVTAGVFGVLAWITFSCARLWTYPSVDENRKGERFIRPRIAAVITMIVAAMAAGTLWAICFTYTSTDLFWKSARIIYSVFVPWTGASMFGWFATIAATIAVQFMKERKRKPEGKVYLASLACLVPAHVFFIILAIMDFPLQYDMLWGTMLPMLVPGSVASFSPAIISMYRSRLAPVFGKMKLAKLVKASVVIGGLLVPYGFIFYLPLVHAIPSVAVPFTERLVSLDGIEVPFQGDLVYPSFEAQPQVPLDSEGVGRRVLRLDGDWRWWWTEQSTDKSMYPRTASIIASLSDGQHLPGFDDSTWDIIDIPRPNCFPYWEGVPDIERYGVSWYRKVIHVPASFAGHQVLLKFFGGGYILDAWVNGDHAGYHEVTHFGFVFDVTIDIEPGQDNVIAIRVDDPSWKHARDPAHVWHTRHLPPSIDFFKYGGLVREIHLEALPIASISRADVRVLEQHTNDYRAGNVSIEVDVVVRCPPGGPLAGAMVAVDLAFYPLSFPSSEARASRNTWEHANRGTPASSPARREFLLSGQNGTTYTAIRLTWNLMNVSFWSTRQPDLYALSVNLTRVDSGDMIDAFWTQTGFRTVATNGTRLLLNGADLVLAGVALHEETWDPHGASMTDQQIMTKLELVQNVSANFIRMGHVNMHPNWYLFSERLGIAAWAESPLCWMNEIHFTQLLARRGLEPVWIQSVYPNLNRPGILFWGGPNEPWAGADCIRFLELSKIFLDRVDGTRFFSYAAVSSHTWHGGFRDAGLPVVTPNNYGGTFDGVRYAFYEETRASVMEWQNNNPGKPFVVMEFGYWREGRWNGSAWVPSFENQIKCLEETFQALVDLGVVGMTWWIAFDYTGFSDDGWYGNGMGVYSLDGTQEYPIAAVMRELYASFTASNT